MKTLSSIELFAGAGGLALGASRAGVIPKAIVEWNKDCQNTILENIKRKSELAAEWPSKLHCDVRAVNFSEYSGKIDLLTGGPPCQPFSMGGRHKAQSDSRDMFPEAIRAIREVNPKAFILENVRGLTRSKFRPYFEYLTLQMRHPYIIQRLDETWIDHFSRLQSHHTGSKDNSGDYRVISSVLNSADYGVPQVRHRVFFVGIRADLEINWSFPSPTHSKEKLISELANGVYENRVKIPNHKLSVPNHIRKSFDRYRKKEYRTLPWVTTREALSDIPPPTKNGSKKFENHFFQDGAKVYPGHTGSPLDFPAKTLKAGVHGVPGGENMMRDAQGNVRYFSIRESARIQTFPDDFAVTGCWSEAMRQLGNAVPVELAHKVVKSLATTI